MNTIMTISVGCNNPNIATGFKVQRIYFDELYKTINSNVGYSTCLYKDGHRKSENYLGGNTFIALDFDDSLTIKEAKQLFDKYIYLITTTRNHQKIKEKKPACDRFRVILPVLYPIDINAEEFKNLMTCLITMYGADPKTVDAARFYFGNPNGLHWYNFYGEFFNWRLFDYKTSPKLVKKTRKESFEREADHAMIIERCAAMNALSNKPTEISYGQWMAGLNVLAFCKDGENLCHQYSSLDPSQYKPYQVQKIYESSEKLSGAALCNSFTMEVPKICKDCIFRGLINSPISLGKEIPYVKTDIVISYAELKERLKNSPLLKDCYNNKEITFAQQIPINLESSQRDKGEFLTREEATANRVEFMLELFGVTQNGNF